MVVHNRKISAVQLQWLVILDWIGKALLLLPRFTGNGSGRSFIVSLILGGLLTVLFVLLIGRLSDYVRNDFHAYIYNRLGGKAAFVISMIYLVYVFIELVYLVRLFASAAAAFLLPQMPQAVLSILLLAGGWYLACGGVYVQGRIAGILRWFIVYPLLLAFLLAGFSVHTEYLSGQAGAITMQTVKYGFQTMIPFGSIGLFLFIVPNVENKNGFKRALRRAAGFTAAAVTVIFLLVTGTFGAAGMRALPWPVITMIGNISPGDGMLRGIGTIFTGLLLLSCFAGAGTKLFYMEFLENKLLYQKGRAAYLPVSVLAALAAALWTGNYETAVRVYVIVNGYILLPLMAAFLLLLLYIEWIKGRKER